MGDGRPNVVDTPNVYNISTFMDEEVQTSNTYTNDVLEKI